MVLDGGEWYVHKFLESLFLERDFLLENFFSRNLKKLKDDSVKELEPKLGLIERSLKDCTNKDEFITLLEEIK